MKYILNCDIYVSRAGRFTDQIWDSYGTPTYKKGHIFNDNQILAQWLSPYKKTSKAPKLYNVELHLWDKKKKTDTHIETKMWNSPYALCKWKKRVVEQELLKLQDTYGPSSHLTDHPDNGYYYKIVRADKKK